MKNILIRFICCSIILLASCDKKTYNCHCDGGFSGGGDTMSIEATSKSKAQRKCDAKNNAPGTADGFYNCQVQ